MVESSEKSAAVKRYERNKYSLIAELKRCLNLKQPGKTATRDISDAVNAACQGFGYRSGATASVFGQRALVDKEKKNLVLTPTKAGYFACALAKLGEAPWASTPEDALYQVYSWCLFGSVAPPPDADPSYLQRLEALPRHIQLDKIRSVEVEPEEERARICAILRACSPEAGYEFLQALGENLRSYAYQPPDDDDDEADPPCNENCVLVGYLRFGSKLGMTITDDDREAIAEATGIPLPRVARLLCGDDWTPEEEAVLDAYVNSPMFNLSSLQAAADARAIADNKSIPLR